MSYNPTRANHRNPSQRRRRKPNPHAGVKHSDIMRRQGFGAGLPADDRAPTPHGIASRLFEGKDFSVTVEAIGAGNRLEFGVNKKADCVFYVLRGTLYIFVEGDPPAEGEKAPHDIFQVAAGGRFSAPRGLRHGVAASGTEDVEVLVVRSAGYEKDWEALEQAVTRETSTVRTNEVALGPEPVVGAGPLPTETPAVPQQRRRDQSKAKAAAAKQASRRARRKPKSQTPAPQPQPGGQSVTGAANVGHNPSDNPNSGNVNGVNPRPGGAGAYRD